MIQAFKEMVSAHWIQQISNQNEIGSISAGKKADFAVLEQDPYAVDVSELRDIPVWGVVFEGKPYAAED